MEESMVEGLLTLLIWGVNVIPVANQSPYGLSQTVSIRLFSALV